MFFTDWFYGVLASLGLWQKEAKILLLGQPEAKGWLYFMLRHEKGYLPGQFPAFPISGELIIANIKIKLFDLGDLQTASRTMRDYYFKVDAVVYVVPRLPDPRVWNFGHASMPMVLYAFGVEDELRAFFRDKAFDNVPLLILEPDTKVNEVLDSFGVNKVILEKAKVRPVRKCTWYPSSERRDGFRWLSQDIN